MFVISFLLCVLHVYMKDMVCLILHLGMHLNDHISLFFAGYLGDLVGYSIIVYHICGLYVYIYFFSYFFWSYISFCVIISLCVCFLIVSNNLKFFFGKCGILVNY